MIDLDELRRIDAYHGKTLLHMGNEAADEIERLRNQVDSDGEVIARQRAEIVRLKAPDGRGQKK